MITFVYRCSMDHEERCARIGVEIARIAEITGDADLGTPVPSCPGWGVAKLLSHTGITHRWVATIVATRATGPVNPRTLDVGLPENRAEYPKWLAAGAAPLLSALRDAGPDTPVWSWAGQVVSGWWARRMLHETTVHRADAELAVGAEPVIDPVVAADGVDEFLANARLGGRPSQQMDEFPDGQTIHLHATDEGLGEDGEWLISLGRGGYTWSHGHAKGSVAVRGPAGLLLLLIYGRIRPDDERLQVFGDAGLLATWQQVMTL
jgi:uncharacterized protein (TIGR03083 family)